MSLKQISKGRDLNLKKEQKNRVVRMELKVTSTLNGNFLSTDELAGSKNNS
jgi:hypothetical protein